jgi:membrane-associated HD superfamily phosphohydrolase
MSRYLSIAKYNLRFNLLPFILAAMGVLFVTPVLFGVTALDVQSAAYPLELALPFIGVVLLTPVYSPEQDNGIMGTVASRETPYMLIYAMRIVLSVLLTLVLLCAFTGFMAAQESEVTLLHAMASFANAVFLGGLGILAASISSSTVIGYMLPVLYFVLDLMGGNAPLTLFSLMRGGTMAGKVTLFFIGLLCTAASAVMRYVLAKRR